MLCSSNAQLKFEMTYLTFFQTRPSLSSLQLRVISLLYIGYMNENILNLRKMLVRCPK